jgi:hypothetical protein
MGNIENYKTRFNQLMESTMGNVKPLISEQTEIEVSPENAYNELEKLNVSSPMEGTRYYDELKFGNLTIKPINFHLLGRSSEPVELVKQNTSVGEIYQVNYNGFNIINFTSNKDQSYIPNTKYISKQ